MRYLSFSCQHIPFHITNMYAKVAAVPICGSKNCLNGKHKKMRQFDFKDVLFVLLSYVIPVHNVSIVVNLDRSSSLGFLSLD